MLFFHSTSLIPSPPAEHASRPQIGTVSIHGAPIEETHCHPGSSATAISAVDMPNIYCSTDLRSPNRNYYGSSWMQPYIVILMLFIPSNGGLIIWGIMSDSIHVVDPFRSIPPYFCLCLFFCILLSLIFEELNPRTEAQRRLSEATMWIIFLVLYGGFWIIMFSLGIYDIAVYWSHSMIYGLGIGVPIFFYIALSIYVELGESFWRRSRSRRGNSVADQQN